MKKKFLVICILGMFLLLSLTAASVGLPIGKIQINNNSNNTPPVNLPNNNYNDNMLSVMRADSYSLNIWENDYYSAGEAFIDPSLASAIQGTEDYSILDLLYYIPEERTQGGCGNCWAWPSTAVLAIALRVQEGVQENRLSVQYINTCGELYQTFPKIGCCEGGTIGALASFYSKTGIAIPWSNENAEWQDYVIIGQCEQVECDEIAKTPNYPIASIRNERITTRNVPEKNATDNIKNILHQQRGVYFSVLYADDTDLEHFRDHWRNEYEDDVYDLDWYAGHEYNDDEVVGHAMLIVGYHDDPNSNNSDYWIVLNSWGTNNGGRPNGLLLWDMHMNYSLKYSTRYAFEARTLDVTFGSKEPITSISISEKLLREYTFAVSADDPQGDDVYLYVSWGHDGENTDWLGPYASGEEIQVTHTFPEREEYTIKAKAKDTGGNVGPEQPLKIDITNSQMFIPQDFVAIITPLKISSLLNIINLKPSTINSINPIQPVVNTNPIQQIINTQILTPKNIIISPVTPLEPIETDTEPIETDTEPIQLLPVILQKLVITN